MLKTKPLGLPLFLLIVVRRPRGSAVVGGPLLIDLGKQRALKRMPFGVEPRQLLGEPLQLVGDVRLSVLKSPCWSGNCWEKLWAQSTCAPSTSF